MYNGKWRQKLHLEPPTGWMNDPNGLCRFNGRYHVYFQYSPDSAEGAGDRGWGHYQSTDMLNWEFTGYVIRPDTPSDISGAYSGSAIVWDNTLHIFYTGNVLEEGAHDYIRTGRGANVITLTSRNGTDFSEKQVLLRNCDYPSFCSCHVRDPKVWRENGEFKMVLGARTLEDEGCVLYYRSQDMQHWEYAGCDTVPHFGYMWECPDHFSVDGHRYLSLSPQGLPTEALRYQNVHQSGYFKADEGLQDFEEWDYGFDFYAPQSFEAPDGRRIIYGWMGIGDIPYTNPTVALGWQHCLTLPREVTRAADGSLLQAPIRELSTLRGEKTLLPNGAKTTSALPCDICADTAGSFSVTIAGAAKLCYDAAEGIFTLRFEDSTIGGGRTVRSTKLQHCSDIRIIADMSSLEIYLNGGSRVLSSRFYPDAEKTMIEINGAAAEIFPLA